MIVFFEIVLVLSASTIGYKLFIFLMQRRSERIEQLDVYKRAAAKAASGAIKSRNSNLIDAVLVEHRMYLPKETIKLLDRESTNNFLKEKL